MLTRSGLGAVTVAVATAMLGWWWSYEELVLIGVGTLALVTLGVWVAQRPLRADVSRRIISARVPRGDPIRVIYRVRNDRRFSSTRAQVIDECDRIEARTVLPAVPGRSIVDVPAEIPTRRRGIHQFSDLTIERIDPFWMAVGRRRQTAPGTVTVHPRIYELIGPAGLAQVVESESVRRMTATDPLSGFVSMREYVPGDDPRLVHWPTTARVGQLMVREHFEVRRPEFTVVLDTATAAADPDDFEEMADVAASVAVHTIRSGLGVVVRSTSRSHPGVILPLGNETDVVDLLTPVQQTEGSDLLSIPGLFASGLDAASILIVTGPGGPSSTLSLIDRVTVVRVGDGAVSTPGVTLAVNSARQFAERWRMLP